ncbi:MAG: 16S rRNA (uracil(1498)-N(3))-methyltransferase [Pseudomonadota bacterium]
MPRYDFISQRLFIDTALSAGQDIALDRAQANYLLNVLRMKAGQSVLVFNGRDGEWRCEIAQHGRKAASLTVKEQTRAQTPHPDLHYLFAPLKQARLEYMVQKAVEMGAGVLQPVLTQHTQLRRINLEKMRAHSIEAAEQCGILSLPIINEPVDLEVAVDALSGNRQVVFCDEGEQTQNPLPALKTIPGGPIAVLVGPEGGFSEDERALLRGKSHVTPIPLGPRVLRADTAAVAALALVQATLGDWE